MAWVLKTHAEFGEFVVRFSSDTPKRVSLEVLHRNNVTAVAKTEIYLARYS